MSIESQIALCSEHYKRWKEQALLTNDIFEAKRAFNKATFWLELQSAFIVLHSIEQRKGNDKDVKMKLIKAKANLSKKLADYAQEIINEIAIKNSE
jgi:hypothetical protein